MSSAERADDGYQFVNVGDVYPEWTIAVTKDYQALKHRCCGIDTDVFGNMVDVAILATLSGWRVRIPNDTAGFVHLDQTATQPRPIRFGERLTVRGSVTAIEPVARGHVIRGVFDFFRDDGSLALSTTRAGMRFGPAGSQKGSTKAAKAPEADPRQGLKELVRKQLTPEGVKDYSDGGGPVHKDPEYARKIGLRSPVAAGVMGMHWMLEALARARPYQAVDIAIELKRPIFWDEEIALWGRPVAGKPGAYDVMRVLNPEGKVTVDGRVRNVSW